MNTWQSGHLKHVTHCCACNETIICRSSIVLFHLGMLPKTGSSDQPWLVLHSSSTKRHVKMKIYYDVVRFYSAWIGSPVVQESRQSQQKEHHSDCIPADLIRSQRVDLWKILIRCHNNQLSTWTNLMLATLASRCLQISTRLDMFVAALMNDGHIQQLHKHFDSTFVADKVGGFFWMQRRERMIQAYAEDLNGWWFSLIYIAHHRDWSGKEEARMRSSIPEMQALRIWLHTDSSSTVQLRRAAIAGQWPMLVTVAWFERLKLYIHNKLNTS